MSVSLGRRRTGSIMVLAPPPRQRGSGRGRRETGSANGTLVDGTPPGGDALGPFVTGDDDVVTGDYANPLENKPVSTIFVIVN